MIVLKNWKAKRSGGRITIEGVRVDDGTPYRVTNVETIRAFTLAKVIAQVARTGELVELRVDA